MSGSQTFGGASVTPNDHRCPPKSTGASAALKHGKGVLKRLFSPWSAFRAYVPRTEDWGIFAVLRRFRTIARLCLLHPLAFFKVTATLGAPKLQCMVRRNPLILLKFSWPVYSNRLSSLERANLLSTHYEYLRRHVSQDALDRLWEVGITLWESVVAGTYQGVSLFIAPPTYGEGEMTMLFRVGPDAVYTLSFVIVQGNALGLKGGHAVFVTRLQGTKGFASSIRFATRSVGDVSPPLILMAAVEGVALALGIEHVVGISAGEQVCTYGGPPTPDFVSAYDDFWTSTEGKRLPSGRFHFPVPLPEKSMTLIKRNHRLRVRNRRAFRRSVSGRVRTILEGVRVV